MIYGKSAKLMVIDLINEANPDLPFALNETDFKIADITAIATNEHGHNTTARIVPKINSGYTGSVIVSYNRIDIGVLFAGVWPIVKHFVDNATPLTTDDLLPKLSQLYGIVFDVGMWNNVPMMPTTGSNYNSMLNLGTVFYQDISPVANNPAYVGTCQMGYTLGKQNIADMYLLTDSDQALNFEMGKAPDSHPQSSLVYDMFNKDFSDEETLLDGYPLRWWFTSYAYGDVTYAETNGAAASVVSGKLGYWKLYFIDHINTLAGTNFILPDRSDVDMDVNPQDCGDNELIGWTARTVDLPSTEFPGANSDLYNKVMVIELHPDCPWATGPLYLHFNY